MVRKGCALLTVALGSLALAQAANPYQPDRTVLPVIPPAFQGEIHSTLAESRALPAPTLRAPAGAPNVLVILLDDAGFGQSSTFGGLIPTPTLDRLATHGLRYTRFHVTAMCSPTRSALLTGRNSHAVGMGAIANWSTDYPGYTGSIPRSAAMISEVLRLNGYATAALGKWHLIPDPETTLSGPFDHWPTRQGFDFYYGFIGAETDQWYPELTLGTQPVAMRPPVGRKDDYTLNEDLATKAIDWIRGQKSLAPDKPFFMYYAPGATHAPLQAPRAWIDKFRGSFDMGWDRYREQVLLRQKELGIVPKDTDLTARPPGLPSWDSLTADQRRVNARLMEVFAGFYAQADHEIGRMIDALQDFGELDNTLVIYIAGDNGASFEGNLTGTTNTMAQVNGLTETPAEMLARLDALGGPSSTPHYPAGWAWAGDTPFQWGKRMGSHFGGTRDPMVISWPRGIKREGEVRTQFLDVTDLYPTILEAAGLPIPKEVSGVAQQRVDGLSLAYTFDHPDAPSVRTTQYFEMLGNRSIYHDGWVAARLSGLLPWVYTDRQKGSTPSWELYHITEDFSEAHDLASQYPERTQGLAALFDEEARKNQVLPMDSRVAGRQHRKPGTHFRFYPGGGHLYDALAPALENRSMTILASVDTPSEGASGVLLADGGEAGGFSLYLDHGKPVFVYNFFRRTVTTVASPVALPVGPSKVMLRLEYDGGGIGKGALASLLVDGVLRASAHIPRTIPVAVSFEETFDIGEDTASPVGAYESPNPFTGTLHWIDLDLGPEGTVSPEKPAKD